MRRGRTKKFTAQSSTAIVRRNFLALLGISAFPAAGMGVAHASDRESMAVDQPVNPSQHSFMQRAIEMRQAAVEKGDQAFGAVIVLDGLIVGQAWSRVIIDRDPTAHAEMASIRDAARRLGKRELKGAVMYSSSRPCPMCEAAAYWARISQMVHGHQLSNAGEPKLCN